MTKQWKPIERSVETKELYIAAGGKYLEVPEITATLPANLRVCGEVEIDDLDKWKGFEDTIAELRRQLRALQDRQAQPVAVPSPDWSQAPEWAVWWAVAADGCETFYATEPQLMAAFGEWTVPESTEVWHCDMIDIPLGVDWRSLMQRRPAVEVTSDGSN